MEGKKLQEVTRIPRSQGILGQEVFYIKNGKYLWSLRSTNTKLWGRVSQDLGETWGDWLELVSNYDGYFSFTVSEENKLHLTCKDTTGNLRYVFWSGSDVLQDILGEDYLDNERLTYQTVLVDKKGQVHLIYFTEDPLENMWRAKYCLKSEGDWSLPEVLDQGMGSGQNQVASALDPAGKIYLIYQVRENKTFQFVYRERDEETGEWSNKMTITSSQRSNLYPSMVIDENGTLHLTWLRSDGMNYRVMYRRKKRGGWMVGGWQKDQIISGPGVNAYTPIIGILDDQVVCIWQQTDGIYQSVSSDQGQTFSEPVLQEKFHLLAYKNLIPLDFYQKSGMNLMSSIDTGSTSVALLAAVFSSEDTETEEAYLNLPELKEKKEIILPNIEYLSIDYGQKGLEKHLQKINGNFQRLLFEAEDIRLTNLQMGETIRDKEAIILELENNLAQKDETIAQLKEREKILENIIDKLRNSITRNNTDFQGKQKLLEKKIHDLEKNISELKEKLSKLKSTNHQLKEQLKEKEMRLNEEEEKNKLLRDELEGMRNMSFWKKLIGR